MADKNITITEPINTTDGVKLIVSRANGGLHVEIRYEPPTGGPFSRVFDGNNLPGPALTDLNSLLTRALNAAKGGWGF